MMFLWVTLSLKGSLKSHVMNVIENNMRSFINAVLTATSCIVSSQ